MRQTAPRLLLGCMMSICEGRWRNQSLLRINRSSESPRVVQRKGCERCHFWMSSLFRPWNGLLKSIHIRILFFLPLTASANPKSVSTSFLTLAIPKKPNRITLLLSGFRSGRLKQIWKVNIEKIFPKPTQFRASSCLIDFTKDWMAYPYRVSERATASSSKIWSALARG